MLEENRKFIKEAKLFRKLYEPRQLKGQLQCVRCWEYDWLSPNGLCGRCIELLRKDFPERFLEAQSENIRLFDEKKQLYYENGIKCK